MTLQSILILYKKDAYSSRRFDDLAVASTTVESVLKEECALFQKACAEHESTLRRVVETVRASGLAVTECSRGSAIDYSLFDCVITVGGDGTFLNASHAVDTQLLIGVNSAPSYSVGQFCCAHANNFEGLWSRLLAGELDTKSLPRMQAADPQRHHTYNALNDFLICHRNPAALSRYHLTINSDHEEQRGSGIWFASPPGSTAAILSAGGTPMGDQEGFQYRPRELYRFEHRPYRFTGQIMRPDQSVTVMSLMPQGMMYIDGTHQAIPMPYGQEFIIQPMPQGVITLDLRNDTL
jgi:NAD+ kinase